jgi:hypothetical protein
MTPRFQNLILLVCVLGGCVAQIHAQSPGQSSIQRLDKNKDGQITRDEGYQSVVDPVHIHDWHATILHLLGLDHEKLTYTHAGRPYRLTDVYGNVEAEIRP